MLLINQNNMNERASWQYPKTDVGPSIKYPLN